MKYLYNIILLAGIFMTSSAIEIKGQSIQQIKIPELEQILNNQDNKLFVVNLWTTWCAPCVKEMPHFEKVAGEYDNSKVKFIMISLDFPSRIDR